jgi:hypothetical protein
LKRAAESGDKATIEKALADFQKKAQKLGEVLYKASQGPAAEAASGGARSSGSAAGAAGGERPASDEPVDADFEVKT